MPLNAGRMSQRITIQRRTPGEDAHGQSLTTWQDVATVWAEAIPTRARSRELVIGQAIEAASVMVRFRIRRREGITADMRVMWRGLAHALVAPPVEPFGEREELELLCASGIGG